MLLKKCWLSVLIMFLLSGCALKNSPIPLGDSELVGVWEHDETMVIGGGELHTRMLVTFTEAGYVSYHFLSCFNDKNNEEKRKSKSLHLQQMPIVRVTTKKIKAQTFPLTPKWEFQINQWPQKKNTYWEMTLDKLRLVKVEGDAVNETAFEHWQCDF